MVPFISLLDCLERGENVFFLELRRLPLSRIDPLSDLDESIEFDKISFKLNDKILS